MDIVFVSLYIQDGHGSIGALQTICPQSTEYALVRMVGFRRVEPAQRGSHNSRLNLSTISQYFLPPVSVVPSTRWPRSSHLQAWVTWPVVVSQIGGVRTPGMSRPGRWAEGPVTAQRAYPYRGEHGTAMKGNA